jgi:CDP-glycerol glycerophosphotransferase (TagB/SpsB family)
VGALIKHCDVLVNVFSTASLEAMLVDRPVVMVSPDAHLSAGRGAARAAPEWPREFAEYEHTRELVERGAARVANSMAELVEEVARYLDDPGRDGAQRREAAARECGPMDGRSGRRVGRYLLDAMDAADAEGAQPTHAPSEPARPRAATGSAT